MKSLDVVFLGMVFLCSCKRETLVNNVKVEESMRPSKEVLSKIKKAEKILSQAEGTLKKVKTEGSVEAAKLNQQLQEHERSIIEDIQQVEKDTIEAVELEGAL